MCYNVAVSKRPCKTFALSFAFSYPSPLSLSLFLLRTGPLFVVVIISQFTRRESACGFARRSNVPFILFIYTCMLNALCSVIHCLFMFHSQALARLHDGKFQMHCN